MFCRFRSVAVVVVLLSLGAGCSGGLGPRTSSPLQWQAWAESGAMADASRGHPVAFWADPSREPATVDVSGGTLQVSQWLTHLALRMNEAISRKTLFDTRFQAVGPQLFNWKLSAGRYRYTYKGKPAATAEMIARTRARAVELRLSRVGVVKLGSENGARLVVTTVLEGRKRTYMAESSLNSGWDVDLMSQIARKILADASFWSSLH